MNALGYVHTTECYNENEQITLTCHVDETHNDAEQKKSSPT